MPSSIRLLGLPLAFVTAVLTASTALASPLLELVGETSASGGGLQARTVPGGSAAAYFNPALLTDTPEGASLGFMVLRQQINLALDGRPGTEFAVPEGIENARDGEGMRFDIYPAPTDLLQYGRQETALQPALTARPRQGAGSGHETLQYFTAGIVVKLFRDRVAFGFHGLIPVGEFTRMRAFFNDEREQFFSNSLHPELYADRLLAVSIALGLGVRLTDWLSLGAGATLALKANVGAGAYVLDAGNLANLLLNVDAPVEVGVSPHVGILCKPTDRFRLTATAHSPQQVELGAGFSFQLPNLIADQSTLRFVLDYMPWRFSLGASYDLIQTPSHVLSVAASGVLSRWSTYRDRHGDTPRAPYGWSDTLSPTLGVRDRLGRVSTALDLTYAPSPVPEQTGRTNYVDNHRVSGALSFEYGFEAWDTAVKVGAQIQAHILLGRYHQKLRTPTRPDGEVIAPELVKDELPDDALVGGQPVEGAQGLQTNNPGWPGFGSIGWVGATSLYMTVEL